MFDIHTNFAKGRNVYVYSLLEGSLNMFECFHRLTNMTANNKSSYMVSQIGTEKIFGSV